MESLKEILHEGESPQVYGAPATAREKREKFKNDMLELFIEFFCQQRPLFLKELIENLEKCIILNALSKVEGNQKEAARALGIKYTTLNEKVKRYNIRFQKRPIDSPWRPI